MNHDIKRALKAAIIGFDSGKNAGILPIENVNQNLIAELETVFSSTSGFLEKVKALDDVFSKNATYAPIQELLFDLLMINFLSDDTKRLGEDYLDTPEWEKIEDDTIDRGTELLNLFLYLKECNEEDIDPELEDYLTEFLLVEEDEFQDEHRIYESVIANQILAESNYAEISKSAINLSADDEIANVFYPLVSFFAETKPKREELEQYIEHAPNKALDTSLLFAILAYHNTLKLT